MSNTRFWETPDELTTISICQEGCVHLRVGRAVIKMTGREFLALAKLADNVARDIHVPEAFQQPHLGH